MNSTYLHTPYLNSDLLECSKNLLNKLKEIENNEQYKGVWAMNYIHGGRYDGPNYAKERDALEEIIKRLEEQTELVSKCSQAITEEKYDIAQQELANLIEKYGENDPEITRIKLLVDFLTMELDD